jgi:hypothetical protein
MASSEDVRANHAYHRTTSDSYDIAQLRRKPVPQRHQDMQSSRRGSRGGISSPPNSSHTARFQSVSGQYRLTSPTPAVQSSSHGLRPKHVSTDSFHSTVSGDSSYSNDTQTSDARLLVSFSTANPPIFLPPSTPHSPSLITPCSRFTWWNPV